MEIPGKILQEYQEELLKESQQEIQGPRIPHSGILAWIASEICDKIRVAEALLTSEIAAVVLPKISPKFAAEVSCKNRHFLCSGILFQLLSVHTSF